MELPSGYIDGCMDFSFCVLGKYIEHLPTESWENLNGEILEGIGKILLL